MTRNRAWKSQKSDFWRGFPRRERRMTSNRAWKTTPTPPDAAIPGLCLPRASHTWIKLTAGQPYLDYAYHGPAIPGSSLPRASHTWIKLTAGQPYLDPAFRGPAIPGARVCWLGPEPQGTPNHTFLSPNGSPWYHLGLGDRDRTQNFGPNLARGIPPLNLNFVHHFGAQKKPTYQF